MMRDLKGPDIFLDGLAEAQRLVGRRLTAALVGAGDDLPKYRSQAERLGLSAHVAFHPPMPARQAFALANAVVVPSRAEAMPYIVLEALAAGMPMIATNVGGIPEIFGPQASFLVKPDAAAVAGRMAAFVGEEAAFRNEMPSQQSLRARFGVDVMARGIEDAYRAALARAGSSA